MTTRIMHPYEVVVEPMLEELLPPLSPEEFAGLEADILKNGVLTPIILWNGVIVDGHNRHTICQKHDLTFEAKDLDMAFDAIEEIQLWAWQHQEHRRNLTPFQRAEIALKFKPVIAKKAKQNLVASGGDRKSETAKSGLSTLTNPIQSTDTRKELAEIANISTGTLHKVEFLHDQADDATKQKLRKGETTINAEYKRLKKEQDVADAREKITSQTVEDSASNQPAIFVGDGIDWIQRQPPCDLLLSDPPYSTDVADIDAFAQQWLPAALSRVKPTGMAYVFIGAYPNEQHAYTSLELPDHIKLEQILVWTYKNTLGNNPKDRYKLNWQAILFYRGIDAPALDCPLTAEQWAVMEVNAPDGRLGNRYHSWQKPMELAERLIRHSTSPGDLVYDPFACTGTFLLAAAKLGRIGLGAEINPDNAAIAKERGCCYAESFS